jgi:hypothetical protein
MPDKPGCVAKRNRQASRRRWTVVARMGDPTAARVPAAS